MTNMLAKFLSYLLHPLFMPMYGLILLFQFNTYLEYSISLIGKIGLFLILFFNTVIAPLAISWILLKRGSVQSLDMETKEERVVPYLATILFYSISCYWLYTVQLPKVFFLITLGATISIAAAFLINFTWKISSHMIGIGGVLGVMLGLSQKLLLDIQWPVIAGFIGAGLLGAARLKMAAHSPLQIYAGFIMGFFVEFLLVIS